MTIYARETGREDEGNDQMERDRNSSSYGSQDSASARGGSESQEENKRGNNAGSQQNQSNK